MSDPLRRTRLLALALLATTGLGSAQPLPLSLEEALARGRESSGEALAALARTRAAEARVREASGHRLPQVHLSERWIRSDSPADAFALLLNQERFDFAAFVAGNPNDPDPLSTAITRLEVEVPLWTGGELSARIEQARLAAAAAAGTAVRAGDRTAVAAAEAWIGLARAIEATALVERSRAAVASHLDLTRAYEGQGMIVRSELLRAEVELARVDDLLAEARGNVRIAEAGLAYRLGEPLGTAHRLAPLVEPPPLPRDLEGWLRTAASRPDLEAARGQLAAGELEIAALRARRLPRIGLAARHDWVDDRLFGAHGEGTTVAAVASVDLFDGGRRRAAVAAFRSEVEAGRADLARFANGIELETRQAYEAAAVAGERRRTARAALSAADEGLRIVEERFRAGLVKTTDVLDAATARREAELRELVARADTWLALLRLALAAGERPESMLAGGAAAAGGGTLP